MSADQGSWLPRQRRHPAGRTTRLWDPKLRLAGRSWVPDGHYYVVVDELSPMTAVLLVSEWPRVDSRGRLRFTTGTEPIAVSRERLKPFLEGREPSQLAARDLRIGDVFAVRPARGHTSISAPADAESKTRVLDPFEWIESPLVDITRQAREATKVAFFASVAPTITKAEAFRLENEIRLARHEESPE